MAIFWFFNMEAAAILDFKNFKFLTAGTARKVKLYISLPNFIEIARTAAEIRCFWISQDGGLSALAHAGVANYLDAANQISK